VIQLIILKHVEYKIKDLGELEGLLNHLRETTSKINGVELKDIYFPKDKDEFVLMLKCFSENKYLEWRDICPPPPGAKDWFEILMTKDEHFSPVNKPTIYPIKPEPTELAKKIYQEAQFIENQDAKHGRTLSKEENDVRRFILTQSIVLERIPSINEIKKAFTQFPNEKLGEILNQLDQTDAIHMDNDKTTLLAAYPFSGPETSHIVTLKEEELKKLYAMCAIDALGVGFMTNRDISIDDKCHHCGEKIEIEIKNNEIIFLKPETTVVWGDTEYSCCAATSCCKNINFFSSEQHFIEWQKNNPKRKGHLLQIQEAFYLGKLYFENRI